MAMGDYHWYLQARGCSRRVFACKVQQLSITGLESSLWIHAFTDGKAHACGTDDKMASGSYVRHLARCLDKD